ncbi:Thiol:disulfide interchange protein DsbD precursor [compost metagenome]
MVLFLGLGIGATDPLTPLKVLRTANVSSTAEPVIKKDDFTRVGSITDLASRINDVSGQIPTLLYVTADWCVTCRTIEQSVLTSPDVIEALTGMKLLSVDLTTLDADRRALLSALKVIGPPTMLFLDNSRTEPASTRLIGEFSASDLAGSARRVRGLRP